MRPTIAEINLANLKYNFLNIRKRVKNTKVMAVVKADAYGHGVKECTQALLKLGKRKPDYFGVALLEEAIEVRKYSNKEPILCFAPFSTNEVYTYLKDNISATICDDSIFKKRDLTSSKKVKVHINIDTGMGRLGIRFSDAVPFIEKLCKLNFLQIEGIYTHFATSDEKDKTFAQTQLKRFRKIIEELNQKKIDYGIAHAANSGAILDMPDAYFDMVRPGISLYGYYPSLDTSESIKLKPVMSIKSKIDSVRDIFKNDSVSYGRKFIAKAKTQSATVPFGYADGFNRNLTNSVSAIIKGKKYKQIGRVTMDRIAFNVKSDKIRIGNKVTLLGKEKGIEINAWDWCKILDTIPYEITCSINKRVPRIYKWI
jgi:alanine racemase